MNWKKYISRQWISSIGDMNIEYLIGEIEDTTNAIFMVLPHFNKRGNIKHYSVWYQPKEMILTGGTNFAIKIKKCQSFKEGISIANQYLEDIKNNNELKNIGSQYIDSDTFLDDTSFYDCL